MKNDESSMTALVSAFARAYHSMYDEPKIFDDPLARRLITDSEFAEIGAHMAGGIRFFAPDRADRMRPSEALKWVVQTQLSPTPLARARYCEDMLLESVKSGAEQYVILGAGMDTFAYRNPYPIEVFEVDCPATQAFKKIRLSAAGLAIPKNLRFVPADFTQDNLSAALIKAGFEPQKHSFISWLGVTYYLSGEDIQRLLGELSRLTRPGAGLIFDYADEELFSSGVPRVKNMVAMAAAAGEPMKSCFDFNKLRSTLEQADFYVGEHLSPSDIEARYFKERTDDYHAFEHIHYVLAIRK